MRGSLPQPSLRTVNTRRTFIFTGTASLLFGADSPPAYASREQTVLSETLQGTSAIATILHQDSGRLLAIRDDVEKANTPGSILKPLLLFAALQRRLVTPTTNVLCNRSLHVGNRAFPCTHPQSNVSFSAQEALAYSCNTWFASLALRFTPSRLAETLHAFHLYPIAIPASPEQSQLLTLGLAGVKTSPAQIAVAYSMLGNQLHQPFAKPVAHGLRDSVSFGMAHSADAPGIDISGKTGTANDPPRQPWSHGWFAGFATVRGIPLVVSLYLPQGNGGDAARLARNVFLACNSTTT